MKKYILLVFILSGTKLIAQIPEDAVRYSWLSHTGTARYMAIGGTMGSLGGDISAIHVNPAGLAFYRTREIAYSPSIMMNENTSKFRNDAGTTYKKNAFNFGTLGAVIGKVDGARSSSAISFAFTQQANFNNVIQYSGLNNHSSYSEQFAEEFARSGLSIDEALNTMSAIPFTAAPALYTYLIDTVWDGTKYVVRGMPEVILDAGQAIRQDLLKTTKGGMYELAFAYSKNMDDKWFMGATLGIPIVSYKSNTILTETDTSSNTTNLFKRATFTDDFKTSGAGANLKLGVIYRPQEYIRLGLAIHTPSLIYMKDKRSTSIFNEKEGVDTLRDEFVSSDYFTNGVAGENTYIHMTPWKAMISASYVFREVENVQRQRGFISADIEYVNHRANRFFSDEDEEENPSDKAYYKSLNKVLKSQYKGAFNFRIGGELKFNVIMARLGFAYYTNPYKDRALKANKMLLSGGLGYRNKGFFIDLTYVHNVTKDAHFPYRLQDRENTFATLKNTQGIVSATVGFKF